MKTLVRLLLVAAAGLAIYFYALPVVLGTGWAVSMKLRGRAADCPWPRVVTAYRTINQFGQIHDRAKADVSVVEEDRERGLQLVASHGGRFWVQRGSQGNAYLFAEHAWIDERLPEAKVRPGQIVIDVGAHAGVFVYKALRDGAGKVVAIEPDPMNLECLRRNFAKEIAAGRVILVPEGAWNKPGTMTLHLGKSSGWNSMVLDRGSSSIEVPVRRIDDMVRELALPRVDYIKIDIEGAERYALEGAMETLKTWRPRLLIDSYHLPDDGEVLPPLIRRSHADYRTVCGPCEPMHGRLVPHVTLYQ